MWVQHVNKNDSTTHVVLSPAFYHLKTFFWKVHMVVQNYHTRFVIQEIGNLFECTVGHVPEFVSFQSVELEHASQELAFLFYKICSISWCLGIG